MDIFLQSFDEFITHSHSHNSEASSSSETSSSNNRRSAAHYSDEEEVMLASARPKKRAGRRIFKETRHPVYRGVRRRNNNRWVCEMRVPNNKSRIWLGTYPTPEMAARAHDVAALTLRGKSACLNFADSAWRLPLPASTKAEEIRRVAAEAAEAFAVEDKYELQSVKANITDNYDVCSISTTNVGLGVMEDDANSNKEEGMYLDEVPTVSAFDEDLHDWLVSIANEPLRSPPPFVRDSGFSWNEVEFDAEVSLWSFTI